MPVYLGSQKVDTHGLPTNWYNYDKFNYMTSYGGVFANAIFPADYEITLKVPEKPANISVFAHAFNGSSNIKKITIIGDFSSYTADMYAFARACKELEEIDFSEFIWVPGRMSLMFYNAEKLKTIKGILDLTNATDILSMFYRCLVLESVFFKENTLKSSISFTQSPNLSDASIQSIIDGLADLTDQTAQTITFHADVKAKLTEEQIATITSKNWTLA